MDTNPTVTISQGGKTTRTITTLTPWTMLSQNMEFHAGDNVELPESGTYVVIVEVPPTIVATTRRVRGTIHYPTIVRIRV